MDGSGYNKYVFQIKPPLTLRSFRLQEVLKRDSFAGLKRKHAIHQQESLSWMEPALGDAVISPVRSVSLQDSSHHGLACAQAATLGTQVVGRPRSRPRAAARPRA